MTRRILPLAALAAALALVPGGTAPAQDTGCGRPADPHGQVIGPDLVQIGETIGFGIEFDPYAETNWATDQVFDVDGPGGHVTLTQGQRFTPPAPGTYIVNGRWTDSCSDGVTPDRNFTAAPLTVQVQGLQPPYGLLVLQNGGKRLPGGGRSAATAQLRVRCDQHPLADPIEVIATSGGRTAAVTRPKGCTAHSLSRSAGRHGKTWALGSSDFLGSATVFAPGRRAAHLELRSGGTAVAAFDVRFAPAKGRERVSLVAKRCATGPCQVLRIGAGQRPPSVFG